MLSLEIAPFNSKQNWTIELDDGIGGEMSRPKRENWGMRNGVVYSTYIAVLHAMNTSFLIEDSFGCFCLIFHSHSLALMLLLQYR